MAFYVADVEAEVMLNKLVDQVRALCATQIERQRAEQQAELTKLNHLLDISPSHQLINKYNALLRQTKSKVPTISRMAVLRAILADVDLPRLAGRVGEHMKRPGPKTS